MSGFLKLISILGLALTVGPALLVFRESMSWATHAWLMLVGALLWFASAPFWMHKGEDGPET